jgi:hypothetical protein
MVNCSRNSLLLRLLTIQTTSNNQLMSDAIDYSKELSSDAMIGKTEPLLGNFWYFLLPGIYFACAHLESLDIRRSSQDPQAPGEAFHDRKLRALNSSEVNLNENNIPAGGIVFVRSTISLMIFFGKL